MTGPFVKAFMSTPYSDSAHKMADFLGVSTGVASAIANWIWLFNIVHNRVATLRLPTSRMALLDQHMAVFDVDGARAIDAMAAAGWVKIEDTPTFTVTFTTWDEVEGRTFGKKAKPV